MIRPFDHAAASYDRDFSQPALGRCLRLLVRDNLRQFLPPTGRVLELGCGTGEDALWLAEQGWQVLASDSSQAMLAVSDAKFAAYGDGMNLKAQPLDLNQPLDWIAIEGDFELVFANFGVLNCVADRRRLAEELAARTTPTAIVALVVMGPSCVWEIGYHLGRGRLRSALRRWTEPQAPVGNGAQVRVWYPSPARLQAEFAPWFRPLAWRAIGLLIPPSYLAPRLEKRPSLLNALARLESLIASAPLSPWLADHYLAIFERQP